MTNTNWKQTEKEVPPENVVVETISANGQQQDLVRRGTLWFFPDMSMYVYYVPKFWKEKNG